jgi:hypothetical protein
MKEGLLSRILALFELRLQGGQKMRQANFLVAHLITVNLQARPIKYITNRTINKCHSYYFGIFFLPEMEFFTSIYRRSFRS